MPWVIMVLSRATTGRRPATASVTSSDTCNKSETITHLVRSHKNNTVCSNILNERVSWRRFTRPTTTELVRYSSGTKLATAEYTANGKILQLLKGNKSQHFGDMDLIQLIKSNNFQQQSYFNISRLPENK